MTPSHVLVNQEKFVAFQMGSLHSVDICLEFCQKTKCVFQSSHFYGKINALHSRHQNLKRRSEIILSLRRWQRV